MNAVDTNILVRLLTADDARQFAAAEAIFRSRVWLAKTVLLESAWVLGKAYGFDDKTIAQAFRQLLNLSSVSMEDRESVLTALGLVDEGLEFADALHLGSSPQNATFVSFDRKLIQRAKRAGVANAKSADDTAVTGR